MHLQHARLEVFAPLACIYLLLLCTDIGEPCHLLQEVVLSRRPTILEGLYTGLGGGIGLSALQLESKMKLLVEAPAAVEDALASLLDHHDIMLQVPLPPLTCSEASCGSMTNATQGEQAG